jgi:hypothetical protein
MRWCPRHSTKRGFHRKGPPLPDGYWPAGLGFDPIVGSVTSLDKLGQPVPTGDLTAWSNRVADPAITPPALAARLKDTSEVCFR